MGTRIIDLSGSTFGYLRVLVRVPQLSTPKSRSAMWLCYCAHCGGFVCRSSKHLRHRRGKSCGCWQVPQRSLRDERGWFVEVPVNSRGRLMASEASDVVERPPPFVVASGASYSIGKDFNQYAK